MTEIPTDTTGGGDGFGFGDERIQPIELQTLMQQSYIDYAMTVIVGRALPDVRDGLKPVHRRILYAMYDGGYRPDRGFSKCSRVVGDVMGQYHPHGDTAIYDTMVRLAQPWVLRAPLSTARATSVRRATTPPRPCDTPSAGWRRWRWRWCATSTRRPSTSTPTTTVAPRSRPSCPRASPTCWSTVGRHRGRYGDQHPAAQPARGLRRCHLGARAPRRHQGRAPGRADRADQGPRLPQRRADRGPPGHRAGLPHRSRLDRPARRRRDRRGQQGPDDAGHHRAPLHGQPGQPRAEDRRARRLRPHPGHLRRPRRHQLAHGPATGHRPQARRRRPRRAQQPVQAHRAADQLLRQHAGPGRWGAAHPADRRLHLQLGHPPGRGHPAAHGLPAARGREACPRAARSRQGTRRARRGDRTHPSLARCQRGAHRPDRAARHRRDPGQRHPRHAAPTLAALQRQKIIDDLADLELRIADLQDILADEAGSGRSSPTSSGRSPTSTATTVAARSSRPTATCRWRT